LREQVSADTRKFKETSARRQSARKRRRSREPSEEAARQAAAVVDHDPRDKPASDGLIWNHFVF
jgi:hypothetical protein